MNNTQAQYPRADVNPSEKMGEAWLLLYAKAAWKDALTMPDTIFWRAARKYQELRDYALGKQSVDKYKPMLGIEDGADESWLSIDLSQRPVQTKFRDIAVSKILQRRFRISATPIDSLAKTKMDEYKAKLKAKIMMRQQITQMMQQRQQQLQATGAQGADPHMMNLSAMMNNPAMTPDDGEPADMEELEMKMRYGIKLDVAIEAEKGTKMIFYQNDIEDHRKKVAEDIFDIGVGGYKEWLDSDGLPKLRAVHPDNMITNFCRKHDFSDMIHVGEVIEVPMTEISKYFTKAQLEDMACKNLGKFGNPAFLNDNTTYNMGFDGFKVQVVDLEVKSDDVIVYKKRVDVRGNVHINKDKWEKRTSDATFEFNGKQERKYVNRTIENMYKVKWVVGTDYVYDFGLAHDIKREPDKKLMGRTTFSYHLYAPNFDNMRCQSMMMRLRPIIDDYHITHYKLQNLKNRMIPNGYAIDLDALESVDLNGGGENMTPEAVLDLLFKTGILIYRGSTLDSTNVNRKPVEPLINSYAQELQALVQELERIKQEMRDMTGLNEVTDGSTPSDRMLNGVASLADTSTNNALYPLVLADKRLLERLSKGVLQRLQIAVQRGDIDGIVAGMGEESVDFIKITQNIALHVWGIMIQDIPSDEERQMLLQQLNLKDQQGQLDPEDVVTIYNIDNLKEARQYLAYKVKKRRQEAAQQAAANTQQTAQAQMQSNQAAEQEKRKTMMMEYQMKAKLTNLENRWKMKIQKESNQSNESIAYGKHETALVTTALKTDSTERLSGLPEAAPHPHFNEPLPDVQLNGQNQQQSLEQPAQAQGQDDFNPQDLADTPQDDEGSEIMPDDEQSEPMTMQQTP